MEVQLTRVRAVRYQMPLKRAYGTARGVTSAGINFLLVLGAEGGDQPLEGLGECQPRHALTGDGGKDRVLAWQFLCAATDALAGRRLRFDGPAEAVASVRSAMADLHPVALAHAEEQDRDRPFRGTLLGIETALLDVVSRALGIQLADLLGRQRDDIGISISTISSSNDLAQVQEKTVKQARFPMTRVKGTGDIAYDLSLLGVVTEANRSVDRERPLWIDINEALEYDGAVRLLTEIADRMGRGELPASIVVEGMLPKRDVDQLPQLQRVADERCQAVGSEQSLDLRIMPDEGMWDVDDLTRLNALGGCRAINIKAPKAGGLLASLDLANAAVAADPGVHICIGGMVGTSDVTAWALHNLARALPRVDYLTTVPPQNVQERISEPLAKYQAKGSNIIARQTTPGLGTQLRWDRLAPYVEATYDTSTAAPSGPATVAGREPSASGAGAATRRLVFAGDTSLGDAYVNRRGGELVKRLHQQPMSFFEGLIPVVSDHDALILNLETVLADSPASPFEGKKDFLGWDSPTRTLRCLQNLAVDAVSLANNHSMDYGAEHLMQGIQTLGQGGIAAFGAGATRAEAAAPLTLHLSFSGGHRRVHIIGAMQLQTKLRDEYQFYADATRAGVNSMALSRTTKAVERLRAGDPSSLIIMFPHWGRNYQWANEAQIRAARAFASAGADLIIGHGAHMMQQCTFGDGHAVIYSLGNFVFNSRGRYDKNDAPPFSLVARVDLGLAGEGWEVGLRLYPCVTDNTKTNYQPRLVTQQEFETVWSLLSRHDAEGSFEARCEARKDHLGHYIHRSFLTSQKGGATASPVVARSTGGGWTPTALEQATGGQWVNKPPVDTPIDRVTFVTRWAKPGRMVATMEPEAWGREQLRESAGHSGHDPEQVAQLAADAGAAALMTATPLPDPKLPTLLVPDTRRAFWQLAAKAREGFQGQMIGITGTVGKSTTRDMLRHVLSKESRTLASPSNWNTIDSVAMTLTGLASAPDFAVIEAAISGFVRVPEVSSAELIKPHCAIITAIGVAHVDLAPTLADTAEHKSKLLRAIQPGGTAVINCDAPYAERLKKIARDSGAGSILTFGTHRSADFQLHDWKLEGEGCRVFANILGRRVDYWLPLPGRGMAMNSLATIAACHAFDKPVEDAIERLATVPAANRVLDRQKFVVKGGEATLIDDTKNAADLSMFAAFELLSRLGAASGGRRIAVLGSIVNLADTARETHARLAEPLLEAGVDKVFTTGRDMDGLRDKLPAKMVGPHAGSPEELADMVHHALAPGDVVLVKGSHRNTGFRRVADLLARGGSTAAE